MQTRLTIQPGGGLPRTRGFTLVEIMIVVAVIGIMGSIALPNFAKARATATPSVAQIRAYFGKSQMPVCPTRGTCTLQRLDRNPTCTRSVLGHTL